jgi:signal peptidase II
MPEERPVNGRVQLRWLWLTAAMIVADQIVKWSVVAGLQLFERLPVLPPVLEITRLHNHGAAFSFLDDAGGWQKYLFLGLAVVVSAGIVVWLARLEADVRRLVPAGLALIAGGAIGNAIDRVHYGYVVDFIHVHWYDSWWFPAFNVADSAITVGAVLLILDALLDSRYPRTQKGG